MTVPIVFVVIIVHPGQVVLKNRSTYFYSFASTASPNIPGKRFLSHVKKALENIKPKYFDVKKPFLHLQSFLNVIFCHISLKHGIRKCRLYICSPVCYNSAVVFSIYLHDFFA